MAVESGSDEGFQHQTDPDFDPDRDPDDVDRRSLVAARDAARRELRATQQELAKLRERVRKISRLEGDRVAAVLHELRTPLTVIDGYHRLLLRGEAGPLSGEQTRFLEASHTSCRRLSALASEWLEAEPPAQRDSQSVDLAGVLEEVRAQLEPLRAERGLELRVELADDARRAACGRRAFAQIATNLVANAIKYADASAPFVVSSRRAAQAGADRVVLDFSDAGPGIAPGDRERIFESRVRLDPQAPESEGLGLGLAISRRLAEEQGGTLCVVASPAGGSCFRLTFAPAAAEVD